MYRELSDVDPHQWASGLIPWYVNGTLAAADAAKLGAHLDGCAPCRRDYQTQLRLYEAMQADSTLVFAAEPSFRKLMARIGSEEDAGTLLSERPAPVVPKSGVPPARRAPVGAARWLAAAVLLEGLGLGYGAWHVHSTSPTPAYITLTSAAPSFRDSPRIRVVFRSGLSVGGLGTILHDTSAHIIDGPTDANVYTLGFSGAEVTAGVVERRVAALRANADVLFAEPLGTGAGAAADDSR